MGVALRGSHVLSLCVCLLALSQGAIRKIMFDQEQKRKGLPTSDELKNEDMLRKAWDAEGSPFKGTPFDPSAINFSGDGGGNAPLPGGVPPIEDVTDAAGGSA